MHNGEFYSTLVKVVYPLTDQEIADGCFSAIPGSHKSNFPNPYGIEPEGIPVREPVPCRAGDAIIFTEATTHGSEPKRTTRPRRTLYFAYSPCWITDWTGGPEISAAALARVTERQRALLELQPMGTGGVVFCLHQDLQDARMSRMDSRASEKHRGLGARPPPDRNRALSGALTGAGDTNSPGFRLPPE